MAVTIKGQAVPLKQLMVKKPHKTSAPGNPFEPLVDPNPDAILANQDQPVLKGDGIPS